MASYDKAFEIIAPTGWDRLTRTAMEVADPDLLNPLVSGKVPLIMGEFLSENSSYKLIRATDPTAPSYAWIEWRGDHGVQASSRGACLRGGTYEADTIVFDSASLVHHSKLMSGACSVGGQTRSGLVLHTGVNLVLGFVTKLPGINGGRLRFIQTAL